VPQEAGVVLDRRGATISRTVGRRRRWTKFIEAAHAAEADEFIRAMPQG